ncbi:LPXTG cell wall anchor domain-containing protein [Enterococcus sp. DIV0840c]|uniref:LPXTG cell wall anchor domain-containing protein n=1 Tax=Enterococcus sp. DIV0840c TaxID=2774772 RepID=UPI003D2BD2B6
MKRKQKCWVTVLIFFSLTTLFSFQKGNATEVQQVETPGSVSFTGRYVPIGTPDPKPPESIKDPPVTEVAKPGGVLPQTNTETNDWLILFGGLLLGFIFLIWKQKQKQQTNQT